MKTALSIGIAIILAALVLYSTYLISTEMFKQNYDQPYREYMGNVGNFLSISNGVIGILLIALGIFMKKYEGIGSGILGGGVLIMVYSFAWAFFSAERYIRILLLAVALIVLIWFGYKKLEKGAIAKER